MKLKLFSLAFDDSQFEHIPIADNIFPINLSKLNLIEGIENSNQFCEHRIFLSDLPESSDAEYIGFTSWRYKEKYSHLIPEIELCNLELNSNVIWVADIAKNWFEDSIIHHKGLFKYLNELQIHTGKNILTNTGFWSNQFICHHHVYSSWQRWFRNNFLYFNYFYGLNYDYEVIPEHENRKAGVFYERFSSLYFSNRNDLIIKQIPNK